MKPPADLDALAPMQLKELFVGLLTEVAELRQTVGELRTEIARLKGLPGPPDIKPSGMDEATEPAKPDRPGNRPLYLVRHARIKDPAELPPAVVDRSA